MATFILRLKQMFGRNAANVIMLIKQSVDCEIGLETLVVNSSTFTQDYNHIYSEK